MEYTFDGYGVLTELARDALDPDEWLVQTRQPDDIPQRISPTKALFVMRRTGGGVERNFHGFLERWLMSFWIYYTPERNFTPLTQAISKVYFEAWRDQIVTTAGHIHHCRNGVGWEDMSDPDLPLYGRATSQFEFLIRPPQV